MLNKKIETGRSLLETLAVLVVIAILLLAGVAGYNFTIHKYKKDQTVKAISELAVRYKLHPISKTGSIEIKSIYPEADRADAVNMKTADTDTGRVRLEVSKDTSYFAVVVNNILDDSCKEYLEKGEYDAALLLNGAKYDSKTDTEYLAFGKDFLKDFDFDKLTEEQKDKLRALTNGNTSKEAVINVICAGAPQAKTAAFVFGDKCPKRGASHYYEGKCWPCPHSQKEDRYGVCCDESRVNSKEYCYSCGCPSGTPKCDADSGQCVECIEDNDCKVFKDPNKQACENKKCVPCIPYDQENKSYSRGCEDEAKNEKPWCSGAYTCEECLDDYDSSAADLFRCKADKPSCDNKMDNLTNWTCKEWPCAKKPLEDSCADGLTGKIGLNSRCSADCACAPGLVCKAPAEGSSETCSTCQCEHPDGGKKGDSCGVDCPCAGSLTCEGNVCKCMEIGETCETNDQCCSGVCDGSGKCVPPDCEKEAGATSCTTDKKDLSQCCKEGTSCVGNGSGTQCCSNDPADPETPVTGIENTYCSGSDNCCATGLFCRNNTCCSGTGELESACKSDKCCEDGACIKGNDENKHCCITGRCNSANTEHPCCENATDRCSVSGHCCPADSNGGNGSKCSKSECCDSGNCVKPEGAETGYCCPTELPGSGDDCILACGCADGLICGDDNKCKASCSNSDEDRKKEGADCSSDCPCGKDDKGNQLQCGTDGKCHLCTGDSAPHWWKAPGFNNGSCCPTEGGIPQGGSCSDKGECCQSGHCAYYGDNTNGTCCPAGVPVDENGLCQSCATENRSVPGAVCSDPNCPCGEDLNCNSGHCCPESETWTEKADKTPACCANQNIENGQTCTSDACCASGNCAKLEGEETGYCCPSAYTLIKPQLTGVAQCCEKSYQVGDTVPDNSTSSLQCCEGGIVRQPFKKMQKMKWYATECVLTGSCRTKTSKDECGHSYTATYCTCQKYEKREYTDYRSKGIDPTYKCCAGDGKIGSPCSVDCPCEGTGTTYYDINGNYEKTKISFTEYYDYGCGCNRRPLLYCRPLGNGQGRCELNASITEESGVSYAATAINCSYNTHDFKDTVKNKCYACPANSAFRENSEFVACCPLSSLAVNDSCKKYAKTKGYESRYTSEIGVEAEGMDCSKMDQNDFYLHEGLYCDDATKRLASCPAGSYCQGGKRISCPAGTYSAIKGAVSCQYCKPGFYCPEGATVATRCPEGYYCPDIDTVEPVPCPPGTYSAAGSAECKTCSKGYYCPGASKQISCQNIYKTLGACPEEGMSAPRPGKPGEYANSATSFATCPKGYKCDGIKQEPCQPGEYQDEVGQSVCKLAPAGSYAAGEHATTFKQCAVGSYAPEAGSASCTKCSSGTYQPNKESTECIACPEGTVSPEGATRENQCSACAEDKTANISATKQQCCAAAQHVVKNDKSGYDACCASNISFARMENGKVECCYPNTAALAQYSENRQLCCTNTQNVVKNKWKGYEACCAEGVTTARWTGSAPACCGKGVTSVARISSTEEKCCSKGTVTVKNEQTGFEECCVDGQRYCRTTAKGSFACQDASKCYYKNEEVLNCDNPKQYVKNGNCAPCPEGQYCDGLSIVGDCPKGTYAAAGDGVCTPCAPGTYNNNVRKGACTKATAGQIAIGEGNTATTKCAANEYPNENHDGCLPCPEGASSSAGASACTFKCLAGNYFNKGTCSACTQNHYCPQGTIDPIPCPEGSFSLTGQSKCTTCADGTYWDPNKGSCLNCPAGSACKNGLETKCPEGTNSGAKASECITCDPGQYFNTSTGKCTLCAKGKYSKGGIVTACSACDPGTIAPETGMAECIKCAAGTYTSGSTRTTCAACGDKKYSTEVGATSANTCKTCEAGYFCKNDCAKVIGTKECNQAQECPAGHYCPAVSSAGIACPKGTYRSETGGKTKADCSPCPYGTYTNTTGSVMCLSCKDGDFSSNGTTCATCSNGGTIHNIPDTTFQTCCSSTQKFCQNKTSNKWGCNREENCLP